MRCRCGSARSSSTRAGRTYAEIAPDLVISQKTVSVHVSSILRKTGLTGRIEMAGLACTLGLVEASVS